MTRDDETYWLNRNELLFNLTLLSSVAAAVFAWANGTTIGQSFFAGIGIFLFVMPMLLSLSWLFLRLFNKQDNHVAPANTMMLLVLLGMVTLTAFTFAS